MTHTHYTCPACDGTGVASGGGTPSEIGCAWCDERGIVHADDLPDIPCRYSYRPHTPTRRRWRDPFRFVLRMAEDPILWMARERQKAAQMGNYANGYMYEKARDKVARVGTHTFMGLMQAEMLARAEICAHASNDAVQAWRGVA